MEEFFTFLLPKNAILAGIFNYIALFTFSFLFAYFVLFICLGCTIEDFARNHEQQQQHLFSRTNPPKSTSHPGSHLISNPGSEKKTTLINEREGQKLTGGSEHEVALKVFREVYRERGVEDACVLDTSESDVDERDSLLRAVREELGLIGYRKPTCETDDEGE